MSSLAHRSEPWISRRMVDTTTRDQFDRERAGAALRKLRKNAGLSQEEAAGRAERISWPSWKNYESGKRAMDNPTLLRALAAIGATPEEHALEVARLSPVNERTYLGGHGVQETGRQMSLPVGGVAHGGSLRPNLFDDGGEAEVIDFARYFTPGTLVLKLAGMSMFPYAEPGGFVTYNPRQIARRGQGCVVEMKDGSYLVKRFERLDDEQVTVTELYPVEREIHLPIEDVKGVYAIGLRGD